MKTILFCCALLAVLVLAQPAAAQEVAPAVSGNASCESGQTAEFSVFLPSLTQGAPQGIPEVKPENRNHCFPNFCEVRKRECQENCFPCGWFASCIHIACDVFCQCYC